jgi:hypothetical protein
VPWWRLIALALAVMVAGTLTAWASGRAVAGRDMVLAVKEQNALVAKVKMNLLKFRSEQLQEMQKQVK